MGDGSLGPVNGSLKGMANMHGGQVPVTGNFDFANLPTPKAEARSIIPT